MADLDQLNLSTDRYIKANPKLLDNVFQHDPLLAYLKENVQEGFPGGANIEEDFIYDGLNGGAFPAGGTFDITEKQVEQRLQFLPKRHYVNITLDKVEVQGLNKGPRAIFKLVDSRMNNAFLTMGANQSLGLYLPGSGASFGNNWNGLAEAINDGTTASFTGGAFNSYGTLSRTSSAAAAAIKGNVVAATNNIIEYNQLESTYGTVSFGSVEPNLGVATVLGYSYIKQKFQTQQRFNDTQDPKIGFNGLKFNNATILKSRYCPGTAISGTTDSVATTYVTKTTQGQTTPLTAYPTMTSETFWWLNARPDYIKLYVSDDPELSYGFTGFKPAQDNLSIVGQVLCLSAITVPGPRYHHQITGITG